VNDLLIFRFTFGGEISGVSALAFLLLALRRCLLIQS
jgi:hypothetical protein